MPDVKDVDGLLPDRKEDTIAPLTFTVDQLPDFLRKKSFSGASGHRSGKVPSDTRAR